MATFLEKKSHYVRLTDVSGAALTVNDNGGLNVNIAGGDLGTITVTPSITDTCGNAIYATAGAMNVNVVNIHTIGTPNNAFDDAAPNNGDNSAAIDCCACSRVAIFGNFDTNSVAAGVVSGLKVYVSQNDSSYYNTGSYITFTSDNDFYGETTIPARYLRLKTDTSGGTLSGLYATVAGKS